MSEPVVEPPADPAPKDGDKPADPPPPDWQAEAEKWQALARKHEDRSKANAEAAKELEKVRREQLTETEKAIAAARDEERGKVTTEFARRLAAERFRGLATAAGVPADDITADLEDRDLSRYVDPATGEPDDTRIAAAVKRLTPSRPAGVSPADLGQGSRGGADALPLAEQIRAAEKAGDWKTAMTLKGRLVAQAAGKA
jgi:hypothetical protein